MKSRVKGRLEIISSGGVRKVSLSGEWQQPHHDRVRDQAEEGRSGGVKWLLVVVIDIRL